MPRSVDPAITAAAIAVDDDQTLAGALSAAPDVAEPELGSRLGPWLLRRLLGRGGMGAVYLAERVEHDFQQRAALKLIKLGMDSGEILRRFLVERRILARLEHPNIARLIDGNVDHRGRPYFVMEWVDGLPLIDYANAHGLDVSARLRLFLKLCDAVAHAHRQLVVHRDLKPGNILVDTRGEPKLLDFGIAKLLQADNTEDTSATGPRFFTRAYAAPEQIRGEPVSTATDVYALGAILFEYLTGAVLHRARSPRHETRELLAQARRQAGSEGPVAVTPRMLNGDLALVVAKAVREESSRRYASVEALAEDLRAFLDGRPVRARADSLSYRVQRFLRRHWVGVLASSAVLGALLIGASLALWQAQIARQEAQRSEAVSSFLASVFESATPEGAAGGDIPARSLLEQGERRIERELANQPAVRAQLYAALGTAWFYIGDYARAGELFEAGRALVSTNDWRTQAALLRGLAQVELASGQLKLARTHLQQALHSIDLKAAQGRLQLARTQSVQKTLLGAEGDAEAARRLAQTVYAELVDLLGATAEETLQALNDLGTWTLESGDAVGALPLFDAVIKARREISGADHPETATAMHNRHLTLFRLHRTAEALAEAKAVVALRRRILPPLHRDLARSLGAQAVIEASLGDFAAARRLRAEALDLLRAQTRPDQLLLGQELTNQATDAFRLGDLPGAAQHLDEALTRLQPLLSADHPRLLAAQSYLALIEIYRGDLAQAERRLRTTLQQERDRADIALAQKLTTLRYLARDLRWQARAPEAIALLRDAQTSLAADAMRPSTTSWQKLETELALAYIDAAQASPAQALLDDLQAGTATPMSDLDQAQLSLAQARLALLNGNFSAAESLARGAMTMAEQHLPPGHWDIAEAHAVWAQARWGIQANSAAREELLRAWHWYQAHRPWHSEARALQNVLELRAPPTRPPPPTP